MKWAFFLSLLLFACGRAMAGDVPPLDIRGVVDTDQGRVLLEYLEEASARTEAVYSDAGKTPFLILEDTKIAAAFRQDDALAQRFAEGAEGLPVAGNWDLICGRKMPASLSPVLTVGPARKDYGEFSVESWEDMLAVGAMSFSPGNIAIPNTDFEFVMLLLDGAIPSESYFFQVSPGTPEGIRRDLVEGKTRFGVGMGGGLPPHAEIPGILVLGPEGREKPYIPGLTEKTGVKAPLRFVALAVAATAGAELRDVARTACNSYDVFFEPASAEDIGDQIHRLARYAVLAKKNQKL